MRAGSGSTVALRLIEAPSAIACADANVLITLPVC
jgi:hypothetical protein